MHSPGATKSCRTGGCIFSSSPSSAEYQHDEIDSLSIVPSRSLSASIAVFVPLGALAQGTLEDYQRAEQFLPGNVRHRVYVADVTPHWIEKTNRFWYRKAGMKRLSSFWWMRSRTRAAPLSITTASPRRFRTPPSKNILPRALPFSEIEFIEGGKALRFSVESPMDVFSGHLRVPERARAFRSAQRSSVAEQALGRLRQGIQPLPEGCFDRHGAAVDP